LSREGHRTRLGVLVSGRGGNLAAILEASRSGRLDAEVVAVLSNKPHCRALEIAREDGVPMVRAFTLKEHGDVIARDLAMARSLEGAGVELVVTAGYDRILSEGFVSAFSGRILNVHPSLLPSFGGGMDAIRQAHQAGESKTGVTVHFIDPGTLDAGRVAAQEEVEIHPGESLEALEERIHAVEHRLLPETIQAWIKGSLVR
jgi:phosphoribosylglycinamide formyltransferase-1